MTPPRTDSTRAAVNPVALRRANRRIAAIYDGLAHAAPGVVLGDLSQAFAERAALLATGRLPVVPSAPPDVVQQGFDGDVAVGWWDGESPSCAKEEAPTMAISKKTTTMVLDEQQVTNGARDILDQIRPYRLSVGIMGSAPILFHRWDSDAVDEKAKAAKGSAAKKEDNVESYVYRVGKNLDGIPEDALGIPGTNFARCVVEAGRYRQDPRSPRKSMMDLLEAGVTPLDVVAPLRTAEGAYLTSWDFIDRRRVTVQRAAVTRHRPSMNVGWEVSFDLLVNLPEYLPVEVMTSLVSEGGRLVGLCDHRPTFGRFVVKSITAHEG